MKKDLLTLFDLTREELDRLFEEADRLRHDRSAVPLRGQTVAMVFQKPSLRTRVSFEVAVSQLGGHTTFLSQESIGIGTRESVHDVALLLSRYCEAIVARLFDHQVLVDLAQFATIPVINALTDLSHPCQVLADLYTVRRHGRLRPGVTVAFVGDGNNVANSWLEVSTLYPIRFLLAAPEGYQPDPAIVQRARDAGVSSIEIVVDPKEAVRDADVVYTDVWTSMGQEAEAEKRKKAFKDYQVSEALMREAPSECLVMHCLPAHRGEEITDGVIDGPRSVVFDQAENRLHVQRAVLAALCSQKKRAAMAQGAER
ncbi:MAG: ornithine carbamoyltransferase [Ignavibacterium sp.]|jgi:ornithine carbamoyltransferase